MYIETGSRTPMHEGASTPSAERHSESNILKPKRLSLESSGGQ